MDPKYIDNLEYSQGVTKECIDGNEIAWGYESIEGKAPFYSLFIQNYIVKKIEYQLKHYLESGLDNTPLF